MSNKPDIIIRLDLICDEIRRESYDQRYTENESANLSKIEKDIFRSMLKLMSALKK